MLEENRDEIKEAGLLWWHERGHKGDGVTVAILDLAKGAEKIQREYANVPFNDKIEASHGANCAGVIHEVAPEADIVILPYSDKGVDYVIEHDIKLVSISMTGLRADFLERLKDRVVFCAAGNHGRDEVKVYPAAYDWSISVGAYIEESGKMAGYSNAGEKLDISSFTDIYLPHDRGNIAKFDGTSCATPFAAGTLACYIGACRKLGVEPSVSHLKEYVRDNCEDLFEPGKDSKSGWGLFRLPKKEPREIILKLDSDTMTVNGSTVKLDSPMTAINGRTMIPLRAVSEGLGANVLWDNIKKEAKITLL